MRPFFTSDIHIDHNKIREFCPTRLSFDDMAALWNEHVTMDDHVYHLGDLSFTGKDGTLAWLRKVNFRKMTFLMGNHCNYNRLRGWLSELYATREIELIDGPYLERKFDGRFVVMHHYPQYVWNKSHHGSYHLHGHCHGSFDPRGKGRIVDVGIDSPWVTGKVENRPFSWEEIENHLSNTPIWNADHHEAKEPRYQ